MQVNGNAQPQYNTHNAHQIMIMHIILCMYTAIHNIVIANERDNNAEIMTNEIEHI